ncbi:hypothetical protein RFI_03346 [Reticulomyxa filosa]|uniref:SAM domain-containing protein n=1 Tax=Reticulomyxa filosa TaxID=46433 RepID=X6P6E7_RETFI|nr:hypothetical protein RFI_03346 [Reticulomyxa filosa]|eukprot:ETO33756.1 hypothetical protein RFI_03346 [Reticulomyxa filosa]
MALRSHKTQELKDWLEANKFGQFFEKICESGVETLDDLRELQTESDVMELAGPNGINMGVVFRRKFVRAVLSLSQSKSGQTSATSQDAPATTQPTPSPSNKTKPEPAANNPPKTADPEPATISSPKESSTQQSKGKGLTAPEQQALNELVSTIKEHTQQLRTSRDDLTNVKKQADDSRKELTELFDKAMGVLVMRKKHLENALNLAETETTQNLKQRVVDLQASAKNLLKVTALVF